MPCYIRQRTGQFPTTIGAAGIGYRCLRHQLYSQGSDFNSTPYETLVMPDASALLKNTLDQIPAAAGDVTPKRETYFPAAI